MISTYVTFIIIEGLNFIDFDSGIAENGVCSGLNSAEAPILQKFEALDKSTSCSEGGLDPESEHAGATSNTEVKEEGLPLKGKDSLESMFPHFQKRSNSNQSSFQRQSLRN